MDNQSYLEFLRGREEKLVNELIKVRRELRQAKWATLKRRMVRGSVREKLDISHLRV